MDDDRLEKMAKLLEEIAEDNTASTGAVSHLLENQAALRSDFVRELDALREDLKGAMVFRALKDLCRELIPPLAAMEAMLKQADFTDGVTVHSHVDSLAVTLRSVLGRLGVEKISVSPGQETFDSTRHLCVRLCAASESPFPTASPRTVVRIVEDGYMLGDRVLHPAKVEVQAELSINDEVGIRRCP